MGSTGRDAEVTRGDFPDGFVFGVATSAYQVLAARVASHRIASACCPW
jgi:beta-glucosidase